MVVCAAFGLTVSEAKTEIICFRAKGMPESTATFSVEAAGQVYNQTNEFVHFGGNVNHNSNLSIEVDRRIRNARCSFRMYTLELYDRPSAPLERKIRMLRAEVLETMLYGCVTWSPCACHYDTLRRAHQRFSIKTGSESIEATLRRRRILFPGRVTRMEDTRLPKGLMFGELVGGACCVGGQKSEWMWCFLDDLRAFGINADQWTTAAQDEGEWRRTAEQGAGHFIAKWITAEKAKTGLRHAVICPNVTGRTKERIVQTKRARAGSLALVDYSTHKWRELVSSGLLVCRCHGVFLWCYVCFVLLPFRLYAFVEAAALRSIVLRYAGAPIATRGSFFLFFLLFVWRCRFFRVFFVPFPFSFCMESTSYVLSF